MRIPMLPKQIEFLKSQEREVLYSGAWSAGKSRALCFKLLMHARIAGNRLLLVRKTLKSLKTSTLDTLLKPSDNLPPVLPAELIKSYNKTDGIITLQNDVEILLSGMDEVTKIGSVNVGAVFVDEALELTEEDWEWLNGRCRNKIDPCNQICGVTNPDSPSHWLVKRFNILGDGETNPNTKLITTNALDNGFNSDSFQRYLKSLTGITASRYRDGLWVSAKGLVFDEFERDIHLQYRDIALYNYRYGVCDIGYTNPSTILCCNINDNNDIYVSNEYYKKQVTPSQYIKDIVDFWHNYKIDQFLVDPSADRYYSRFRECWRTCKSSHKRSNDRYS